MPLPLLAAAAANAATLFSYNRQNFMYNKGQEVQRAFTGLNYKLQQFQLYRQDIRDLASLTTVRMSHYHVVGALELGMCATLLGPARLPSGVPDWVLWHQLVALCAAFAYLVASMWFATRAAVAAESFNVRLQTQWIRLPVPDDDLLDGILTRAEDFEVEGLKDMLRVPFLATAFRRVFRGAEDAEASADAATMNISEGLSCAGRSSAAEDDACQGSPALAGPCAAHPAQPAAAAAAAAGAGEVRSGSQYRGPASAPAHPPAPVSDPAAGLGPAPVNMSSMSSLSALNLYQQLQRNWSCFDAYSRVCMSVGTYWLILSMAYYEIGYTLCHSGKPMPAVAAALMLTGVVLLLIGVDLFAGFAKMLGASVLLFTGPVAVALGAWLERVSSDTDSDTGMDVAPWSVLAGLAHIGLSVWLWHEGSIVPGKADLPIRFRGVVYLDIFGPIVRQLRGFLDSTGLGQHAVVDDSDEDEEPETAEDVQARQEVEGGLVSEDVLLELRPGEEQAKRLHGKTSASARARLELASALVKEGPSSQQRRALSTALRSAEEAGLDASDVQVSKACCLLARLSFPGEVRRLRRLLRDWRDGVVGSYLEEDQQLELQRMCGDMDVLHARLGLRPQTPGLPRSMSLDTAGSAGFTPAWTRITHDTSGYGDANDAYEYWVGTAQGPQGGPTCQASPPPAGVPREDFADVRARCADLLARAEFFASEAAQATAETASEPRKAGLLGGWPSCSPSCKLARSHTHKQPHGNNRHRKGHQPVVGYRLLCVWLLATWCSGALAHFLRIRPVRRLLWRHGQDPGYGLDAAGRRLGLWQERAGHGVPLSPPREVFFRPQGLQCWNAQHNHSVAAVGSNGFLVYRLNRHGGPATAPEAGMAGMGEVDLGSAELSCPVPEHSALVAASCDAEGAGCEAVIAAQGRLWRCRERRTTSSGAATDRPLATLAKTTTAASSASSFQYSDPELWRHWAPADSNLTSFFVAASRGPILQLRRRGDTEMLRPTAELWPEDIAGKGNVNVNAKEDVKVNEWLLLTVARGTLLALAAPGPRAMAWDLASGKFLGSNIVGVGEAAGTHRDSAGGWCLGAGGTLFHLEGWQLVDWGKPWPAFEEHSS